MGVPCLPGTARRAVPVLLVAGALAALPLRAQSVDPLDPYGLQPKKPAEKPAEKPKPADPAPPPPAAPVPISALWATPDAGITLDDIENSMRQAVNPTPKKAEENPYKDLQDGIPRDRLGATLPDITAFSVEEVLEDPALFAGQRIKIVGHTKRECETGCWMEVAAYRTSPKAIRVIPEGKWNFAPGKQAREVTAFGVLKKRSLTAQAARALDTQAGAKPTSGARVEWVLEAEGAEVRWLD